jgi:hypothetical protein
MSAEGLKIIKRVEQLEAEKSNWMNHWQDCAYYTMPRNAYITRFRVKGERLPVDIYDSTAIDANQTLSAGLHGYLTNPSSRWFQLGLQNREITGEQEVGIWLKIVEQKIFDVLNNSNFNQVIHEAYQSLGTFGTACVFEEADEKEIVRFYNRPIGEMSLEEDYRERVNEVYRRFELSAKQAWDRWGESAGEGVKNAIEKKQFERMFIYYHAVFERTERDAGKTDSKNLPYASIYVAKEKADIISEGGFNEFPFFCPRFNKVSGDVYGYSPTMVALADIRMLNAMSKTIIKAAQKIVDPPLILPHDGFLLPLNTNPGKVNFQLKGTSDDQIRPLATGGNIPIGLEMEEQRRTSIKRKFFVDLFLMLAAQTKNMTATEVNQRVEEKMLLLGPSLGRLMNELLDPIIFRTFSILLRQELVPAAPPSLEGQTLRVEYISPLAKAQRISEITSLNGVLSLAAQMAEFTPDVLDKIDSDQAIEQAADIFGVDPRLIRDAEAVQKIRAARAEQQAQQQKLEQAAAMASAAKDGAAAEKDLQESTSG